MIFFAHPQGIGFEKFEYYQLLNNNLKMLIDLKNYQNQ